MTTTTTIIISTSIAALVAVLYISQKQSQKEDRDESFGHTLLIGASTGIGRELAINLSSSTTSPPSPPCSSKIILVARGEDSLLETKRLAITSPSSLEADKILTLKCDITSKQDLEKLLKFTDEAFDGDLQTLIFCAGVLSSLPFAEIKDQEASLKTIMSVNFEGSVMATHLFLPLLSQTSINGKRRRRKRIVVISSAAGYLPSPTRSLYSASKAALCSFFNALRIELSYPKWRNGGDSKEQVQITILNPGSVNTNLRSSSIDFKPSSTNLEESKTKRSGAMSAKECASEIVKKVQGQHSAAGGDFFIPSFYWYLQFVRLLFPNLIDAIVARKYL